MENSKLTIQQVFLPMNRHMTTAYSDKLIYEIFMDPDPRSRSGIRDPDPGSGSGFLKNGDPDPDPDPV